MTLLPNSLNIDSMYIHNPNSPKSIEFCFLFLTSAAFRKKSIDKQTESMRRLRKSLSDQLKSILESDNASKTKRAILDFPEGVRLPEKLLQEDHELGNDFTFIIEELVKTHSIVFAVQDFFVAHPSLTDEKRNVIVIQRKGKGGYYPVYAKNEAQDSDPEHLYVLPANDLRTELIRTFHVRKEKERLPSPSANMPSASDDNNAETDPEEALDAPVDPEFERKTIVAKVDIEFEDFDEELLLNYNTNKTALKFTKDEELIYIQNLLVEADPDEKATGSVFQTLMEAHDASQNAEAAAFSMRPSTIVSTANKALEDYQEYNDRFSDHSKRSVFPYIDSPYSAAVPTAQPPVHQRDVVRNAFTTTYDLWNEEQEDNLPPVDHDECARMSKNKLLATYKRYAVPSPGKRPNRTTLCNDLLRHNFLTDVLRDRIASDPASLQKALALLNDLPNVPKKLVAKNADSNDQLAYVIRHALPQLAEVVDLRALVARADLLRIATDHNMDTTFDTNTIPSDDLFDALTTTNLLTLNRTDELHESKQKRECEEDDVRAHIQLVDLSGADAVPASRRNLQMFRPLEQDNITPNGLYYEGEPSSPIHVTFDLEDYVNLLRNIRDFLPLKCVVRYHTSFDEVSATLTETLENDAFLKIVLASNKQPVYFNLTNITDNRFFVYPDIYDGYRYFKADISRNIFFKSNAHSPDQIKRIVAPTLAEYTQLFGTQIHTFDDLKSVLARFDVDPLHMTAVDHETILPSIRASAESAAPSSPSSKGKKRPAREAELVSRHEFLRFNNENISDTHKMVLLQRREYYADLLELCARKIARHTPSKLEGLVASVPPADGDAEGNVIIDIPPEIEVRPNTFEELRAYRNLLRDALRRNNSILSRQRQSDTLDYVDAMDDTLEAYRAFMGRVVVFFTAQHEKAFVREMIYTKPSHKRLKGSDADASMAFVFMNTNPTAMHAPLSESTGAQNRQQSRNNTILAKLITLMGAPIVDNEKEYIVKQTESVFLPKLTQLKVKQAGRARPPNQNEMTVWSNYTRAILYAAFITIFTQYKHRTEGPLFKRCKNRFSIRGYPLDTDARENSFVKYAACVVFSIFARQNSFFQSEKHCETQITQFIKLVFQNNKIIQQLFDTRAKEFRKTRAREEKAADASATKMESFRPFYGADALMDRIQNDTENTAHALADRGAYAAHRMNNPDREIMLSKEDRLFQLLCDTTDKTALPPVVDEFVRIRTFDPTQDGGPRDATVTEPPLSEDEYDERVSTLLEGMRTDLGMNLDRFVDTFVAQKDPSVARYAHLIKPSGFYDHLTKRYPERFDAQLPVFIRLARAAAPARSSSLLQRVHDMIDGLLRAIGTLVDTDNVFVFMNISIDPSMRELFGTFVAELEVYLNKLVDTFESQAVDVDALKNLKEVLREDKKQIKMHRFDGLEDDQMNVIMELEQLMNFTYVNNANANANDANNDDPDGDDAENEEMDDRAEDDDYDE